VAVEVYISQFLNLAHHYGARCIHRFKTNSSNIGYRETGLGYGCQRRLNDQTRPVSEFIPTTDTSFSWPGLTLHEQFVRRYAEQSMQVFNVPSFSDRPNCLEDDRIDSGSGPSMG